MNLAVTSVSNALQALTTRPLAFLRATFNESEVSEIYPSRGAAIRGPFGLCGKLRAARATITLHFGFGQQETFTRSIDLDAKDAASAPVGRIWAQKKLAELELDPSRNASDILAVGQKYSIVTRGTSLIVLDSVDDYLRYRITPPDDLRAEYDRRATQANVEKAREKKDHIEQVVAQFEERKTWWRTEFKPGPLVTEPKQITAEGRVVGGVAGGAVGGGRAQLSASLPPPSAPSARAPEALYESVEASKAA